ncbi:hypothetical protein GH733_013676 [Mirounga leonina]|nr:hypothetical protein GH733_013676 [Mirounga leonina]
MGITPSIGHLKGVTDEAGFRVSLQSSDQEHQEIARRAWEEKQRNEELTRQIASLQTEEEASLQRENSPLESEIQWLRLKLQILPESHQEHILQLQRKLSAEETPRLAIEKKRASLGTNPSSPWQIREPHGKTARDLGAELERTPCHCHREVLFTRREFQKAARQLC